MQINEGIRGEGGRAGGALEAATKAAVAADATSGGTIPGLEVTARNSST